MGNDIVWPGLGFPGHGFNFGNLPRIEESSFFSSDGDDTSDSTAAFRNRKMEYHELYGEESIQVRVGGVGDWVNYLQTGIADPTEEDAIREGITGSHKGIYVNGGNQFRYAASASESSSESSRDA